MAKGMRPLTLRAYRQESAIIDKYRNYIFQNKFWYPKGIKTHVLFMVPQWMAAAGGVARVSEEGFRLGLSLYQNKYIRASYDPRDFSRIAQFLIAQNKSSPRWIDGYAKRFWESSRAFSKKAGEVYFEFRSGDIGMIRQAFENVIDLAIRAQSYGYLTEVFTLTKGEYWVTKHIKNLAPSLADEDIAKLVQPSIPSFLIRFVQAARRADAPDKARKLLREFYWVKGSYFTLPRLGSSHIKEERRRTSSGNPPDEEGITKEKKAILSHVPAGRRSELESFVHLIEVCIAMQDERKANVLRLNYSLQKLISLVRRQHPRWTEEDLLGFTPHEMVALMKGTLDERLQRRAIRGRDKGSVWVFVNGGYAITDDAQLFRRVGGLFSEKEEKAGFLRGFAASPGTARGKARIILSEEDFPKMRQGDIIVTSMTRPEFMPVLKKAAVLVTDEGGITCHAAIVSRELQKPCVIGTKNATKVLHDGDVIEVDADKGVVRVIT